MLAPFIAALLLGAPQVRDWNPLVGIWRSDAARTQRAISKAALDEERRQKLSASDLFGRTVYVFDERRALIITNGECSETLAYRYHRRSGGRLRVLFVQPDGEMWLLEIELRKGELRTPIGRGPAREVFRKTSPAEGGAPCIEAGLATEPPALDVFVAPRAQITTPDAAAEFAAVLANRACEQEYGTRPFYAALYPADEQDGRWRWGMVDPLGPDGYSAVVSFEVDGGLPLVRLYSPDTDDSGKGDIFNLDGLDDF